jgi:integrase
MAKANPTRDSRARKSPGGVIEPTGKRRSWAIRFTAYGKRRTVSLGTPDEGWTRAKAEAELRHTLADVERGIWQPPEATPEPVEPKQVPSFHCFATDWLEDVRHERKPRTVEDYEWALELHLLRHFGPMLVSEITIEDVDEYRRAKVREGCLSGNTINKTITRLAQILEVAVEYRHLDRNPARGSRRRLTSTKPKRIWLEPDQVGLLLAAAGELDTERLKKRCTDPGGRRAILATLTLAGLRVGELIDLRWRDVDLAAGRLRVVESKTDAGRRTVDLSPDLRSELKLHRAKSKWAAGDDDLVFATRTGGAQNRNNIRRRVLLEAIERANANLATAKSDVSPLPTDISPHGLRHTFASLLVETNATPAYVMAQLGHSNPKVTFSIYAHVLDRKTNAGERLDALVRGPDRAQTGAQPMIEGPESGDAVEAGGTNSAQ